MKEVIVNNLYELKVYLKQIRKAIERLEDKEPKDKKVAKEIKDLKTMVKSLKFPKPHKQVEIDWDKMPKQKIPKMPKIPKFPNELKIKEMPRDMRVDWNKMPAFPKIPKSPEVQKVLVKNFPDEIPNRIIIDRNENDEIKSIAEHYDTFTLTMDISHKDKRTEVSIKKV